MTPVALTDAALGLEAQHVWGSIILNGPLFVYPRIELDRISGLYSLGEIEDQRQPHTGRIGERIYPALMRGKTVVYEGRVQARTLQQLRQVSSSLRAAFSNTNTEGGMIIVPDPAYGTQQFTFAARPMSFDMDEEQTYGPDAMPSPYQREFNLALRMSDPRMYAWPTPAVVSGIANPGFEVFNSGTAPADPVIVMTGLTEGTPPDDLQWVRNYSIPGRYAITGPAVQLYFRELPNLEDVTIDFHNRLITQDGEDVTGYLNLGVSDWWDAGVPGLIAGNNAIVGGRAANLQVTFYHAFF